MSKAKILENIRKNRPETIALPELRTQKTEDIASNDAQTLLVRFKESLKQVGGAVIDTIGDTPIIDFEKQEICNEYSCDCALDKLYQLDTIILTGKLGVAENGAIWLDESVLPNRLLPFVTQQLVIKLPANQIVSDMQEAYQQINLTSTGFGVFISGPSKTADIEQSLVYGAHGAKQLTVVLT